MFVFRNIYANTYTHMHVTITNEKETMNLKKCILEGLEGWKRRRKRHNYIIISKINNKNKRILNHLI